MKSRPRRLKAIELALTPQQLVLVWLRNALQAGTFEDGAQRTPSPRGAIANAVRNAVRSSMKGQPELLVERAVVQARRDADSLYNLIIEVNMEAIQGGEQREREFIFLWGYLRAEMRGKAPKDRVENLRRAVLMFLEHIIVLDSAIAQVKVERLNGQPVLFRDCSVKLEQQLQMVDDMSEHFNVLARAVNSDEINLDELRNSLGQETDRQISIWVALARLAMLNVFGEQEETQAALGQCRLLFEPNSAEGNNDRTQATR